MKYLLKKIFARIKKQSTIVIVSGLPRCGTSMMMQMLEAGGISTVTDHLRKADEENPRGYYEFEKVKDITEDTSWLENCNGKAIKMVSALLCYLPKSKKYKIIFMDRNMEEMLVSQDSMLKRLKGKGIDISHDEMVKKLEKHLWKVKGWLAHQSNMEVIYINYNEVIQNPQGNARIVHRFLGCSLDVDKMLRVVDGSLYRKTNSQ